MAALYIHNAVFSSPDAGPSRHIRNISSLSAGTRLSGVSATYSHPTEPLLDSDTSESLAYRDLLLRQPAHPDGLERGQNLGLSLDGDERTAGERKGHQVKKVKRRLRCLKVIKGTLEVLFGVWALHNIVIYFLAYTIYSSKGGQVASFALGTSVTISLALQMTSAFISLFRPYLLLHNMPIRFVLTLRAVLLYSSLFFLLAPALVSFALTFAWRTSSDMELRLQDRCTIGIDVVWTAPPPNCRPSKVQPWGVWLALSIVRVLLSIMIIIFYHVISRAYHNLRRPSSRYRRVRPSGSNNGPTGHDMVGFGLAARFSLASEVAPPPSAHSPRQGARASFATDSSDEEVGETTSTGIHQSPPAGVTSRNDIRQNPDHDFHNFVDHFKSLVSQITRETDEALEFARPGYSSIPDPNPLDETFDPYLGYPTSVRASPDRIHVLGGVIHRMPTIESMGSHEMASPSLYRDRDRAAVSPSADGSSPTQSNARSNTISTQSQSRSNSYDVGYGKQHEVVELSGGDQGATVGVPLMGNRDSMSSYYTSSTTQSPSAEMAPPGLK